MLLSHEVQQTSAYVKDKLIRFLSTELWIHKKEQLAFLVDSGRTEERHKMTTDFFNTLIDCATQKDDFWTAAYTDPR
jgi:hypothetical protein